MAIRDENGEGLMAAGQPLISTSVHKYDYQDLYFVSKSYRHGRTWIKPKNLITWNIDLKQMGVGGDNSWGARPHAAYTIEPGSHGFSFIIKSIQAGEVDPGELFRGL
jgi:beta-galactosidase